MLSKQKSSFGEIVNGEMELNIFGKIASDEWLDSSNIRDIFLYMNLLLCLIIFMESLKFPIQKKKMK